MLREFFSKLLRSVKGIEEKRKEPRYQLPQFQLVVEFGNERMGLVDFGSGADISMNGILFSAEQELKEGEVVDLSLHLPKDFKGASEPLQVKAEIMRIFHSEDISKNRIGCRFKYNDEATQNTLEKFMKWLEKHPG